MKNKRKKIILTLFAFTILILLALYLSIVLYFQSHFFFGSSINGIDSSRKTVDAVEESIRREVKNYVLQIEGRNGLTDVITADSIDYKFVSDGSIQRLLNEQNPFAWIPSIFNKQSNDMQVTTTLNDQKLTDKINSLVFLKKENMKAPVNARVAYNETAGNYEIVPEDNASLIKKKKFHTSITEAIKSGDTYLSIEDSDCYVNPKYTSDSTELKKLSEKMNQYVNVTITYEFGDKYEICDKTYIQDWLEADDDFNVTFNLEKVRGYIDSIARIHNTFGKTRDFVDHSGKVIEVSGGDYGWLMDRATETNRLVKLVKAGKNVQVEPTYSQTAKSHGKNDIGDNYVEIDLSLQHVWVYKEGKLVVESDCVTGNSSRGHDTPTGLYQITYKQRDATLKGENYSSEVKYWMPFYYNVGLHDASWRRSFGGTIYKHSGSHGCVNLPPNVAELVYANVEKGTPIVCYDSKTEAQTVTNTDTDQTNDADNKNTPKPSASATPKPVGNTSSGN